MSSDGSELWAYQADSRARFDNAEAEAAARYDRETIAELRFSVTALTTALVECTEDLEAERMTTHELREALDEARQAYSDIMRQAYGHRTRRYNGQEAGE